MVFAGLFMGSLAIVASGCGAGSAPENTPRTDLPPEVKQANKSMEDFEKERKEGKK
jgi:hypothetical protein